MMLPTYYKCKECECDFPHEEFYHASGVCKSCLIAKKDNRPEVPCSAGLARLHTLYKKIFKVEPYSNEDPLWLRVVGVAFLVCMLALVFYMQYQFMVESC